jgi:hypothetical protein
MSNPHVTDWMLVLVCAPGREPEPAGLLLLDAASNRLSIRLKPSLNQTDESILEVWQDLAADLDRKATACGGAEILAWLESTASHVLQVSVRNRLEAADLSEALQKLYFEHVEN